MQAWLSPDRHIRLTAGRVALAGYLGRRTHELARRERGRAMVLGLMLVSLVRLALGTKTSARLMMKTLSEIEATQVRAKPSGMGRPPTWLIAPDITPWQKKAIEAFALGRWFPALHSARPARRKRPANHAVA